MTTVRRSFVPWMAASRNVGSSLMLHESCVGSVSVDGFATVEGVRVTPVADPADDSFARAEATGAAVTRTRTPEDRKSTRLNSSHVAISYAVFCLTKKK